MNDKSFEMPKTFLTLTAHSRVLLGQFSISNVPDCQNMRYLGKQWLPAALAAIVRASDLPVSHWTTDNVNDILYNADDLYTEIVLHMRPRDDFLPPNQAVDIKFLENGLSLFDRRYRFSCKQEPTVEGYLYVGSTIDLPLKEGLCEFFAKNHAGFLNLPVERFAIFQQSGKLYLFHSNSNYYSKHCAVLFEADDMVTFYELLSTKIIGRENDFYTIQAVHLYYDEPAGTSSSAHK